MIQYYLLFHYYLIAIILSFLFYWLINSITSIKLFKKETFYYKDISLFFVTYLMFVIFNIKSPSTLTIQVLTGLIMLSLSTLVFTDPYWKHDILNSKRKKALNIFWFILFLCELFIISTILFTLFTGIAIFDITLSIKVWIALLVLTDIYLVIVDSIFYIKTATYDAKKDIRFMMLSMILFIPLFYLDLRTLSTMLVTGKVGYIYFIPGFILFWNARFVIHSSRFLHTKENKPHYMELDLVIADSFELSPREKEVLILIIQGANNQDISDQLYISLSTVKQHVSQIYKKLDIKNRSALLARFHHGEL